MVVSLFPFYWIVITSLKTPQADQRGTTSLLPGHMTFSNYVDDFTQQDFIRPLLNSVLVCGCHATVVTVILASLAGYALSRTRIRGKPLYPRLHPGRRVLPGPGDGRPAVHRLPAVGLLNTYPALIIA